MRKDPSNPKYIKVDARIGLITREVIRTEVIGQIVETEDNMEMIGLDKAIKTIIFKGILENIEMIGVMTMIEAEIGQEKGHLQEVMVIIGIEVPVTVNQGQDPELVQIEKG